MKLKFLPLLFSLFAMCCHPALAVETGPAGSVLRVPAGGGRAKMGAMDLASSNATTGLLSNLKINGFTIGGCLFGKSDGTLLNESASNCFWDQTAHSLSLGANTVLASALIDMESTTKGFLPPRMTTTQKTSISSPATGLMVYDTTNNALNVYSGSVWAAVGSGAGGGSKNYLQAVTTTGGVNTGNGDFELGSTTGWSKGTVTLTSALPTGVPTFSSGSNANLAISAVNTSQLSGTYSLSYASSAATTAGDFLATSAFNIDTTDQNRVLSFKFSYKAQTNPGNANWSGSSSNSFGVAIYDVTNSTWIVPAGVWSMIQSNGVGIANGSFQTSASGTSYRLVVYNANATSGAATVYFDDFSVGPQPSVSAPAMSDWVAYTPTIVGFGTTTSVVFYSKREGDTLKVHGNFTAGTVSATTASVSIGYNGGNANVSVDTSKITTSKALIGKAGSDANSTTLFDWDVTYGTATTVYLGVQNSTNPGVNTGTNGSTVTGTGNVITMYFEVPISGWSSNTSQSADTDTRVVAMQVVQSAPTATVTSTPSLLKFTGGVLSDTHGAFSTTTGLYTCPVTGYYRATAAVSVGGTYALNLAADLYIAKNGTNIEGIQVFAGGAQSLLSPIINTTIFCNAGDTLAPYIASGATSPSITANGVHNYFTVERLSGPAVVQANESVNMSYTDTSGGSIGTSAAVFTFATKNYDSHNAYSGGTYTCPVSGKYRVSATLVTAPVTLTTSQSISLYIFKNTTQMNAAFNFGNGTSQNYPAAINGTISCNAGDTISIKANSAVATTGFTAASYNNLSIERLGN